MKAKHSLQVFIKQIEQKDGEFLAFYQSEVLAATFFLYFKDNITGSIALNSFLEMLRQKYSSNIDLCYLEKKARFHSKAILDIVTQNLILTQL
jgi:hypothetical protein